MRTCVAAPVTRARGDDGLLAPLDRRRPDADRQSRLLGSDWSGCLGYSPFSNLPREHFRVILADPPWSFSASKKGRPQHYPRMTDSELMRLPVEDLAHPDGCWLFLWTTSPRLFLTQR